MRRLEMGDEDVNNYGSPCGAHAAIAAYVDRGGRDAEAVRDLRHADVGIGQHCLGGFGGRPPVARRAAASPAWVCSRIRLRRQYR